MRNPASSPADSLVANNLVLAVYRLITNLNAASTFWQKFRRGDPHSTPTSTVHRIAGHGRRRDLQHVPHEIPSVAKKAGGASGYTRSISDPKFETNRHGGDRQRTAAQPGRLLLRAGIFFTTQILRWSAQQDDRRRCQFQYILREHELRT
jgi:ribonucleoside-diphosphate reductase beta chain